ncbi:MAG: hypothetical protein COT17_05185 [Elusimicrobia bacterium CG08_land_8_20_14_0_20_51_18]|nr:MAG: hypothetical protein COT17_05185 [Elusimicrobia bacterium CG08_land_8_20_14_0_20_51_18]
MKKLIGAGILLLVLVFSFIALWLSRGAKACLEPGVLGSQMNKVVKFWADSNIDQGNRTVDVIISDALNAGEAEAKKEQAEGEVSDPDAEILPAANKPSFFQVMQRTFFRETASAEGDTDFIKAFNNRPNIITWTHKGRISVSEKEMAAEITKVILRAGEAGADINIVTQGFAAAPALKAIDALKTANRNGRVPVVNKLVALDMNRPTLERINPAFSPKFQRPDNLKEWVNMWRNPSAGNMVIIELHNSEHKGKRFSGGEIFIPFIIQRGISDQDMVNLVKNFIQKGFSLQQVLDYLFQYVKNKIAEAAEKGKQEAAYSAATSEKAQNYKRKFAMQSIEQPINPLDAISMGLEGKNKKTADGEGEKTEIKSMTWEAGAEYCKKKGQKLPGLAELKNMWKKECSDGENADFCKGWFWSSQETKSGNAWYVAFSSGRSGSYRKASSHYVWCVP